MREFVEIACYFIFAMMWNLLAGYGGMVSIGQQAFFGFGGYAMLMLGNFAGVNPFVAVPLGALAAALIAVPVSFVAFRLQGGYFAIGTWVIAEVFRLSFANVSAVGGGSGTSLTALRGIERATRESVTYWMALACVVAAIALVYLFLRSKRGLALLAIRDNEVAAESQGIAVRAHEARGLRRRGLRRRAGRRAVLRRQPAHQPRRRLQRQLDRVRDLHGGDRRHRPHRGADRRRARSSGRSTSSSATTAPGTCWGSGLLAIVVTMFFKQGLWGWAQQRWGWMRCFRRSGDSCCGRAQAPADGVTRCATSTSTPSPRRSSAASRTATTRA